MLTFEFNPTGLTAQIDALHENIKAAVRPAAQAAAQVYYDEVKIRAARAEKGQGTGLLARSIFQKYVLERSLEGVKATYHISWNKGKGKQTPRAPHGHLIEYGWVQRYATYIGSDGEWYTAVQAKNRGKEAPWGKGGAKRASQAVKDDWFVMRKNGPVQWTPKSFLRSSAEAMRQAAADALTQTLQDRLKAPE